MNIEFRYMEGETTYYKDRKPHPVNLDDLHRGLSPKFLAYVKRCRKTFENSMLKLEKNNETTPHARMSLELTIEPRK